MFPLSHCHKTTNTPLLTSKGEMSCNSTSQHQYKTSPCGACRYLRRKCIKGECVFAPFFDSEEGVAHFAAVHKVFGASNASKMLMAVPPHQRLDTVVALCYEALARVKDPVYGCVAHIFNLQQQVVKLQAELAYIQGKIFSALQCHSLPPQLETSYSTTSFQPASDLTSTSILSTNFDLLTSSDMASFCGLVDETMNKDVNLQATDHEFVSRYWPSSNSYWKSSVQ